MKLNDPIIFREQFVAQINAEARKREHQLRVLDNTYNLIENILKLGYSVRLEFYSDDDKYTQFVQYTIKVLLDKDNILEIEHKADIDVDIDLYEIERIGDFEHEDISGWYSNKEKILNFLKEYRNK